MKGLALLNSLKEEILEFEGIEARRKFVWNYVLTQFEISIEQFVTLNLDPIVEDGSN